MSELEAPDYTLGFNSYTHSLRQYYPSHGSTDGQQRRHLVGAHYELLHSCLGLAGEVGELIDAIKKPVMYFSPWDNQNILEELGDCYHFLDRITEAFHLTDNQCRAANLRKLEKRFPGGYSHTAAQIRRDKNPSSEPVT
jgi:hypothetical protein